LLHHFYCSSIIVPRLGTTVLSYHIQIQLAMGTNQVVMTLRLDSGCNEGKGLRMNERKEQVDKV
jgi:hypothetical protein